MTRNLGFKRIGYDLFIFADMRFSINRKSLASIEYQLNQTACNSFFLIPNLSFFVLGFNVDHSKLMRLSFCHVLPTLETQNLTYVKYTKTKNDVIYLQSFDDIYLALTLLFHLILTIWVGYNQGRGACILYWVIMAIMILMLRLDVVDFWVL